MFEYAEQTALLFRRIHPEIKNSILRNIADNYGITLEEAEAEVTEPGAENLLEYLRGEIRTVTNLLLGI